MHKVQSILYIVQIEALRLRLHLWWCHDLWCHTMPFCNSKPSHSWKCSNTKVCKGSWTAGWSVWFDVYSAVPKFLLYWSILRDSLLRAMSSLDPLSQTVWTLTACVNVFEALVVLERYLESQPLFCSNHSSRSRCMLKQCIKQCIAKGVMSWTNQEDIGPSSSAQPWFKKWVIDRASGICSGGIICLEGWVWVLDLENDF